MAPMVSVSLVFISYSELFPQIPDKILLLEPGLTTVFARRRYPYNFSSTAVSQYYQINTGIANLRKTS